MFVILSLLTKAPGLRPSSQYSKTFPRLQTDSRLKPKKRAPSGPSKRTLNPP